MSARPSDVGERDTVDVRPDPAAGQKSVWVRRGFLLLLACIVLAGLFGLFGVRSASVTARGPGVRLTVRYARIARAGLPVPFEITVVKPSGFDGDVVLAVSQHYLDLFDQNAMSPQPDSESSIGTDLVWRFNQPQGTQFKVTLDMQVQSGRHWGRSGSVTLLDASHRHSARVTFTTWLSP